MAKDRREYRRLWRLKHRDRLNEKYRSYHREYYRKYRSTTHKKRPNALNCNSRGRIYELLALEMLKGSLDKNVNSGHYPWDIEWNGFRIDVKSIRPNKRGYFQFVWKPRYQATHFLCFCVTDLAVKHVFLVPRDVFGKGFTVTLRKVSALAQYSIK